MLSLFTRYTMDLMLLAINIVVSIPKNFTFFSFFSKYCFRFAQNHNKQINARKHFAQLINIYFINFTDWMSSMLSFKRRKQLRHNVSKIHQWITANEKIHNK